jgi:hypothetical protein
LKKNEKRKNRIESESDSFLRMHQGDAKAAELQANNSPTLQNKMDSEGNLLESGILLHPLDDDDDDRVHVLPSIDNGTTDIKTNSINKSNAKDAPKDSTGGSGEDKNGKTRKDRFGTKISRGKKKHKVTFKDQVGKGRVAKVYFVESFKKYNVEQTSHTCS